MVRNHQVKTFKAERKILRLAENNYFKWLKVKKARIYTANLIFSEVHPDVPMQLDFKLTKVCITNTNFF